MILAGMAAAVGVFGLIFPALIGWLSHDDLLNVDTISVAKFGTMP